MTWEAIGVIVGSLAGFSTVVSVLALLLWKRLQHVDRDLRGEVRISRRDKRALTADDTLDHWWAQ